jgi:hypothetical protein
MKIKYAAMLSLSAALALAAPLSSAQSSNGLDNPDWAEEQVPLPPVFSKDNLIPLDMPSHVSLMVGVDPESIAVGGDGVVRYVIVMTNATGSTNAVYEGIRCISDEVKTYARLSASGQWSVLSNSEWKAVNDNMPSHHAQVFARQGGCQNRLATSKQEIITALKTGRLRSPAIRPN